VIDGKARGIIARDLVTGEIERHSAHAVVIASGGYGNVFSYRLMRWVVMQLLLGK
jgi:succinate dehydrogenase / fumarate reductase flavoprotein subunit